MRSPRQARALFLLPALLVARNTQRTTGEPSGARKRVAVDMDSLATDDQRALGEAGDAEAPGARKRLDGAGDTPFDLTERTPPS